MLVTPSLVMFLSVVSAAPEAAAPPPCEPAFAAKFESLKPLLTEAARFREAAVGGKTSFTDLVNQGEALKKNAARSLEKIQDVGCDLSLEDSKRFDACISPVQWGCESVPPGIDWSLLKDAPKSEEEAKILALSSSGVDLLAEKISFAGGCGDFGCAPKSIALPGLLGAPEKVDQLVTLAARPGLFGQRAARSLEVMSTTLSKAKCEGGGWHPDSPKEMQALITHLEAKRAEFTEKTAEVTRANKAVQKLTAALKKGLPKKTCKMPGY